MIVETLGLNRSSFYLKEKSPDREEQELLLRIIEIKNTHKQYGYRRVTYQLLEEGRAINHKKVRRLMKENDLLCSHRKNRKKVESIMKSTYLTSKLGINLIHDLLIQEPFQVIQTDFTELITISGKYYLIVYLCHYTKVAISWEVSQSPNLTTVVKCLKPVLNMVTNRSYIHQDQGSVFTSDTYIELLRKKDLFISYSETATPTDNAEIESFFGRLKEEWSEDYCTAKNLTQLRKIMNKAMNYYNHQRIHTTIKSTPVSYLLKSRTNL